MSKELQTQTLEAPGENSPRPDPALAHRVRDVLLAFGGEAHRSMVIEQVARSLGHDARKVPSDLQAALIQTFEEAWRDEQRRAAYGFHLPFGEGSHRWGLRQMASSALH